jgi:hypothetical protein
LIAEGSLIMTQRKGNPVIAVDPILAQPLVLEELVGICHVVRLTIPIVFASQPLKVTVLASLEVRLVEG